MENENNMTTEEYPAHPIAALFPMMKDDTEHPDVWEKFKSDIKANGVQEPGVLWKGQIIDGRNRQAAAIEVGVPFRTITKEFPEGGTSIRPLFWASRHFVPFQENIAEHLRHLALVIRPVQITGFLEDVAD